MDSSSGFSLVVLILVMFGYFLPTAIAASRGRDGVGLIALLNALLGWTILGWFVLLVVAFAGQSKAERDRHEQELALLKRMVTDPPPKP